MGQALTQHHHLLLLGAGAAHLHLLAHLAKHPMPGLQVTLVASQPQPMWPTRLPSLVAGRRELADCQVPLEPLVRRSGVRWLQQRVLALDTQARAVLLEDGDQAHEVHYEWLSVNAEPAQQREHIEATLTGAREHALFVHPVASFAQVWPRVAEMGAKRGLRLAVIGNDRLAIELAFALRVAQPGAAVTWITDGEPVAAHGSTALQAALVNILRQRRITVLVDKAVALSAGEVQLGSGARLACDVSLLASGAQAAAWLQDSGLRIDGHGKVATDDHLRCVGQEQVFCTDSDRHQAGPVLTANVLRTVAGKSPQRRLAADGLQALALGDQRAILSWRQSVLAGHLAGWLQRWLDWRAWQHCQRF